MASMNICVRKRLNPYSSPLDEESHYEQTSESENTNSDSSQSVEEPCPLTSSTPYKASDCLKHKTKCRRRTAVEDRQTEPLPLELDTDSDNSFSDDASSEAENFSTSLGKFFNQSNMVRFHSIFYVTFICFFVV